MRVSPSHQTWKHYFEEKCLFFLTFFSIFKWKHVYTEGQMETNGHFIHCKKMLYCIHIIANCNRFCVHLTHSLKQKPFLACAEKRAVQTEAKVQIYWILTPLCTALETHGQWLWITFSRPGTVKKMDNIKKTYTLYSDAYPIHTQLKCFGNICSGEVQNLAAVLWCAVIMELAWEQFVLPVTLSCGSN